MRKYLLNESMQISSISLKTFEGREDLEVTDSLVHEISEL